jgi:predicted nuclease of predicted toxin-antitoxin system
VKLLLDENLSRRLVPFLQHDYPGSSQVVLLGLESASDQVVWQKAHDEGFVIVTRDADFQELSLIWGQPPKVVRLDTPNQSRAATLKLLLESRLLIEDVLEAQGFASIEISLSNSSGS